MGVDSSSLTVIISSVVATMPVLLAAYKVWVKNRKVEFTLKMIRLENQLHIHQKVEDFRQKKI